MRALAMFDWLSVKDRLPEKVGDGLASERVLIAYGVKDKRIDFAKSRIDGWAMLDNNLCPRQELITHWMPLPEPPKEDDLHEF